MSKFMYISAVLFFSAIVGNCLAAYPDNGWKLPGIAGYWDDVNNWTLGHLPYVDTNDVNVGGLIRSYYDGEQAQLGGYYCGSYFEPNRMIGVTATIGHAIIRKDTKAWRISVGNGQVQGVGILDIMQGVTLDLAGFLTGNGSNNDCWSVVNMYGGTINGMHLTQWSRFFRSGTGFWNQYGGTVNVVMNMMCDNGRPVGYINVSGGTFNTTMLPVTMYGKVYVNVSGTGTVYWGMWPITYTSGGITYPITSIGAGTWFTVNGGGKLILPGNLTTNPTLNGTLTSKSNIIATYPSPTWGGDNTEFTTDACGAIPMTINNNSGQLITPDFNLDCKIDMKDMKTFASNWLKP
jgi:hypothetical protein